MSDVTVCGFPRSTFVNIVRMVLTYKEVLSRSMTWSPRWASQAMGDGLGATAPHVEHEGQAVERLANIATIDAIQDGDVEVELAQGHESLAGIESKCHLGASGLN
jgi:hypothetical protein